MYISHVSDSIDKFFSSFKTETVNNMILNKKEVNMEIKKINELKTKTVKSNPPVWHQYNSPSI